MFGKKETPSKQPLRLWTGPADPAAAVAHAVPHTVVPQLLRRLVAACLSPEEVHLHTLRDATCCVTALTSGTSSLFDGGNEAAFEFDVHVDADSPQGHVTTTMLSGFLPEDVADGADDIAPTRRLDDIPTTLPNLCSLDLKSTPSYVDLLLRSFAASRSPPFLKVLVVSGEAMSPAVATTVASFHSLEELRLVDNCTDVKSPAIAAFASLPALTTLELTRCPNLNTDFFGAITQCRALRHVILTHCTFVHAGDASSILPPLPLLDSLDMSHCTGIKVADFEKLSTFDALRRITLSRITDPIIEGSEIFKCVGNVPTLEVIALMGIDVNHTDLCHLARLSSLRVLSLRRSPVGPECCAEIAKLQHLEELHLPCCYAVDSRSLALLAADPSKQQKLKVLDISYTPIDAAGLRFLSRLRHLKELRLEDCPGVNNNGLAAVSKITSLEVLDLQSCEGFDIQGVRSVAWLPKLRSLDLTHCKGLDRDTRMVFTKPQQIPRLGANRNVTFTTRRGK